MDGWIVLAVVLAVVGGAVSMVGTVRHGARDLPRRDRYKMVGIGFMLAAVVVLAVSSASD